MTKKNPETPKAAYRKCLVTFIDLLGFKEMLKERTPEEIAQFLNLARQHARDSKEIVELYEGAFFAFSDSLVRIRPIDSKINMEYPNGILFYELLHLVHAQGNLANRGIFVRGATTIGDMYFDSETAFGPALVKAYQLESQTALYPRIIIDPTLLQELEKNPLLKKDIHTIEMEKQHIEELLRLDADGFWHIDYLRVLSEEADSNAHYFRFLKNHKTNIESKISTDNPSVYAKMAWLTQYHNGVIKGLRKEALEEEGLSHNDLIVRPQGPLQYNF